MAYPFTDNCVMTITDTIARNLAAWMQASPDLDTIQKVASRSKVGFGTVRRLKNGTGNPTIKNLTDIAQAFKKKPEDLLRPLSVDTSNVMSLAARELDSPAYTSAIQKLIEVANTMSTEGQHVLLGRAEELARLYPRSKKTNNHVS